MSCTGDLAGVDDVRDALTKAGDFDRRLKVLKIGQGKSGKVRRIRLPDVTAAFFETSSRERLSAASLLSR